MPFRVVGRIPLPQRELWHVQLAVNSRCRPYSPESGIGIEAGCRMSTEFLRNWKCNLNGVDGIPWQGASRPHSLYCFVRESQTSVQDTDPGPETLDVLFQPSALNV